MDNHVQYYKHHIWKEIKLKYPDIKIFIDTYKPEFREVRFLYDMKITFNATIGEEICGSKTNHWN
jgi:hypothetical protein